MLNLLILQTHQKNKPQRINSLKYNTNTTSKNQNISFFKNTLTINKQIPVYWISNKSNNSNSNQIVQVFIYF